MTTFPHIRITAEGTLGSGSGNEIWSCSLKIGMQSAGPNDPLEAPTQADLDDIVQPACDAWSTFITTAYVNKGSIISTWGRLVGVKASAVAANGRNDPQLRPAFVTATGDIRGGSGQTIPYQVAVVATLLGDRYDRGSAGYGRIYLPVPNLNIDGGMVDGLMLPGSALLFARSVKELLIDPLNAAPLTSGTPHAVANIGDSADRAGTRWQRVRSVRVDTRPDTVRRRYSALSGRDKQSSLVTT